MSSVGTVSSLVFDAYIFALACFLGFIVISKVPSILHTPLMSATNAIHGIVYVGAIYLAAGSHGWIGDAIAACAVALGAGNVVGGFVVTDRILPMFKRPTAGESAKGGVGHD
jgi:NAD(P) transhydrogenase subunit alpha